LGEALRAEAIDLVDVATPPSTHLELIDEATGAGSAVICQKPFCGGLEDAKRAVALAESRGAPLVVHENFRFQPWWRRVRAEMIGGRIGEPYGVSFRLRPGDGQGPRAYLDRQSYFQRMERFLVHETAVHLVDVFRFLLGEPLWVWADLRRLNPAIAGEDAGLIVLGFPGGVRALFDGNRLADHRARDRRLVMGEGLAEGAEGAITLDGDGRLAFRAHGANEAEPLALDFPADRFGGGCVSALQAHVVEALHQGRTPENTGRAYLANLRVVEAIYASAETGERVNLAAEEAAIC
jgi:predicted dehydrogenase